MGTFKSAIAAATLLSVVAASSAANAEPVRATASIPAAAPASSAPANKMQVLRTTAPAGKEAAWGRWNSSTWTVFVGSFFVAGLGSFFVFRKGRQIIRVPVSP